MTSMARHLAAGATYDQRAGAWRYPDGHDEFDCGCILRTVVEDDVPKLAIQPCSQSCRILRLTLEASADEGRPVEYRLAGPA